MVLHTKRSRVDKPVFNYREKIRVGNWKKRLGISLVPHTQTHTYVLGQKTFFCPLGVSLFDKLWPTSELGLKTTFFFFDGEREEFKIGHSRLPSITKKAAKEELPILFFQPLRIDRYGRIHKHQCILAYKSSSTGVAGSVANFQGLGGIHKKRERERELYFWPARLGCEHMAVVAWMTCRSVYWTVYLCRLAVAIQSMVQ